MTDRKEALQALLARVEAGTFNPSDPHSKDTECLGSSSVRNMFRLAYRDCTDVTIDLFEKMLPGWSFEVRKSGFGGGQARVWNPMKQPGARHQSPGTDTLYDADTPVRALLIATLKALIAEDT